MDIEISGYPGDLRDLFDKSPEAQARRDKEAETNKSIFEEVTVGHEACGNRPYRHGTVPAEFVKKYGEGKIVRVLTYYLGSKPAWHDKQGNLEYVYQATGGPRERCNRPWQWCGEAILPEFVKWHAEEEQRRDADWAVRSTLRVGDRVAFTKSKTHERVEGSVTRILTLIHVRLDNGETWRVPAQMLTKLGANEPIGLTPQQRAALKAAGLL